ncbi:TRAP transporter substrate-binding protein [Mycolicibacterium sp.]|uniref:TRAP transporter substrate-binding protein n=1 Tax=Mycolicibacterium sp. TaxID=2320850 RepID=UPI0037C66A9D
MRAGSWGWRLVAALAAALLALGLVACGDDDGDDADTSGGGDGAQISLVLGYVTPAEHPYGIAIDEFVKRVSEQSGGAITIETRPNYPGGDVPLLQDVRDGAVQMASVSAAVWGTQGVNSFDALQAMGLITRYDLEREVITGPIATEMLQGTEAVGLKGLAIHEGGLRKPLGATKQLTSPAAFKGLTIRTPESAVLETGIRALGADPTSIPVGEIYSAMRDGTVDGMEANLGLVQTYKLYEVAKFVSMNVNLWPFPTVLVMNQSDFDALSADQQAVITEVAAEIPGFSIDILTAPSELPQTLCDEGVRFAIATPEELAQFKTASDATIAELSKDETTKGFIEQIQALAEGIGEPPAAAPLPEGCTAN